MPIGYCYVHSTMVENNSMLYIDAYAYDYSVSGMAFRHHLDPGPQYSSARLLCDSSDAYYRILHVEHLAYLTTSGNAASQIMLSIGE